VGRKEADRAFNASMFRTEKVDNRCLEAWIGFCGKSSSDLERPAGV
jgi:hypothetical protein